MCCTAACLTGPLWFSVDNVALELQRKYNKKEPVVYNTYQCYLRDSVSRIRADTERAKREDWWFACKLVRGAYMEQERALALKVLSFFL